jgi:hypothetical protein
MQSTRYTAGRTSHSEFPTNEGYHLGADIRELVANLNASSIYGVILTSRPVHFGGLASDERVCSNSGPRVPESRGAEHRRKLTWDPLGI